jgi:aminoglycoside 6'-N-acetyltransferase
MRLRPATLADAPLLSRWDEEPHVLASDPNDDWLWEDILAATHDWGEQLIAELDGRPIGMIQIIDPAREVTHDWGACEPNSRAKRSRPESPFPPPAAARYGRA